MDTKPNNKKTLMKQDHYKSQQVLKNKLRIRTLRNEEKAKDSPDIVAREESNRKGVYHIN